MSAPFVDDVVVENTLSNDCGQTPDFPVTTTHLVNHGRSVRRLVLTQPPHFRTGADIAPAGPTTAERIAVAALQCSGFARLEQTIRAGTTKATVPTPKQQTKKIQRVLEHRAGIN